VRAVEVGADSACVPSRPSAPSQSSPTASSAPWRPAGGAGVPAPAGAKGLLDFLSTLIPRRCRRPPASEEISRPGVIRLSQRAIANTPVLEDGSSVR